MVEEALEELARLDLVASDPGLIVGEISPAEIRHRLGAFGAEASHRADRRRDPVRVSRGPFGHGTALRGARRSRPTHEFADFHVVGAARDPVAALDPAHGDVPIREHARHFNPLPAEQAFPLLEWGLNWCVATQCHQYLILHAAVLERGGRALIMPAPPGSGKSTLCAALVARGWRLFSDELALIEIGGGQIVPLPRPISLKNESIDRIISGFWPEGGDERGRARDAEGIGGARCDHPRTACVARTQRHAGLDRPAAVHGGAKRRG